MARLAVGALGVVATVVALLFFFAFLALRVPWEVPDRAAVTGPTVVLDRDGAELARFTAQVDRRVVDLEDVSTAARNAVIASEDARFYEHTGVDAASLLRAVVSNVRTGGVSQGGSTPTQQYVKNAHLSPERSITRKVREAVISIALERQMDKDEILESYLNEVYFGVSRHDPVGGTPHRGAAGPEPGPGSAPDREGRAVWSARDRRAGPVPPRRAPRRPPRPRRAEAGARRSPRVAQGC